MTLQERVIAHGGGLVRYLIGGSGPAILLCHGFIGSAENFDDWLPALLPRRTVIVPDLPGFGRSTPLHVRHTPRALAHAAIAAADDAGVTRFDVAGLCLGSSVAMAVQRQRRDAVQRVILHTPLLNPGLVRRHFHLQVGVMTAPGVWPGIVWLARQRLVSDLYKRLMVEGPDVDPVAAQVNFDNQMRAIPRAAREWLRDGLACDEIDVVRTGARRTLILMARHDRVIDVPRIVRTLGRQPNVELAVIDEAGHAWTDAMRLLQRDYLAAFLDDLPLATARTAAA
ncbi:MAG TPA: alpha/beta fold hydrolase [Candidatus Dormibacteraeota bacterium]